MKVIEYKVTFSEGQEEIVRVRTRTINAGFSKALRLAKEPLGNGTVREISRVEFWMVV